MVNVGVFPPVALALLRLQGREDVHLGQVAEIISTDASLAAELIRVANSAFNGVRGEIVSLGQAAAVLGLRTTLGVAAAVTMRASVGPFWGSEAVRRCWRHNLATALMADAMANIVGAHQRAAHCAGLLHDSGRLGLVSQQRGIYIRMLGSATAEDPDLRVAERAAFGMDHTDVGLAMFDQLDLPVGLRCAIARHHDTLANDGAFELEMLVQCACAVVTSMGFGALGYSAEPADPEADSGGPLQLLPENTQRKLAPRLGDLVSTVTTLMDAFECVL
jgi:putative nucleotidyltransferase with HDIG domain